MLKLLRDLMLVRVMERSALTQEDIRNNIVTLDRGVVVANGPDGFAPGTQVVWASRLLKIVEHGGESLAIMTMADLMATESDNEPDAVRNRYWVMV